MDERLGSAGGRERVAIVKPPDSPAPLQPIVYARHGRCLMGFKSPVRDRTLEEISIPNDHYESAIMYSGVGRVPGNGHPYPILASSAAQNCNSRSIAKKHN